jgi:hypothetical protein
MSFELTPEDSIVGGVMQIGNVLGVVTDKYPCGILVEYSHIHIMVLIGEPLYSG